LTFRSRLTFDVQAIGPDLSDRPLPRAGDGLDEVILAPDLDHGVIDEDVDELSLEGVADGEHLMIDRHDAVGSDNPDTLSSRWRLFLAHSGLPHVRFHDLRHGHATLMLLKGVHPKVVSERLGHASVGITLDIYSHVLPSMQQDAVRAFDELFGA
jgi:hypothetical protein